MKKTMRRACAVVLMVMLTLSGVSAMAKSKDVQTVESSFKGIAKVKLVNKGKLFYGDKVTLKAVVKVNGAYSLQWQVLENGQWKDIQGETQKTYDFVVTPENQNTQYRVMVTEA